jgi:hypothetical protein
MAAVLAASDALNRGVSILVLAKDFWRAASDLEMFVAVMDSVTEAPRDEIEPVMAGLEELHCRIKELVRDAHVKGLTKRLLTGLSILRLDQQNEEFKDSIERFRLSLDPTVSEAIGKALEEYGHGETVGVDSL